MVTFLFSVHTVTEAKQSKAIDRAVDLPARSFDLACSGVAPPLIVRMESYKQKSNPINLLHSRPLNKEEEEKEFYTGK